MIGLDTNILARHYVEDESDAEAVSQHQAARRLMESGQPLMVSKSVVLEFEWVLRGYYGFRPEKVNEVIGRLLSVPRITIEDREAVEYALSLAESGFDFADALHHASYRDCSEMASFDDRKFARRAKRKGLVPSVRVPM
jgi:predicted nucleic-acid-binding protein